AEVLAGPHVAVLSVSRTGRGPLAIPVWYEYADGLIRIVTAPDSLHGRVVRQAGHATVTIRGEAYGDAEASEGYVFAEGPARFTGEDVEPIVRRLRRRYHPGPRSEEWGDRPIAAGDQALVIEPKTIVGREWTEHL